MLYLLCLHEEFAIAEKRECCCHCLECESLELGLCVWAGVTHCLLQSAVDGLCLAVAAFSETVVVLCAANSGLHKGKRGGIICGFVLVLHIGGEKKAQNDQTEQDKDQILQCEVLPVSLSNGCKHYCYSENGYVQLELLFLVRGVPALQRKCRTCLDVP